MNCLGINCSPSLDISAMFGASLVLSTTSVGPMTNTWVICCPKPQRFVFWSSSSCSPGSPMLASWDLAWQQEGSCTLAVQSQASEQEK